MPSVSPSTVVERTSPAKGESHLYECTVLLSPGTSPEQVQEIVKEISVEASGLGGEVRETDLWGRRGLAYNIAGNTEALFVVLSLTLPPSAVQELSRSIRIMKPVLRHLLIKPEPGVEFVRYSERFELWKKEREQREHDREKEQEEKLKQQILRKVAAPKVAPTRRVPAQAAADVPKASIEEQLEEIISDENLHL